MLILSAHVLVQHWRGLSWQSCCLNASVVSACSGAALAGDKETRQLHECSCAGAGTALYSAKEAKLLPESSVINACAGAALRRAKEVQLLHD